MRRAHKLILSLLVVTGICCGLPSLWFMWPTRKYAMGSNIRSLGLDKAPQADLRWASTSKEAIRDFFKRTGTNAAHFSGSLVLARPGERFDDRELQILDGRLANYSQSDYSDAELGKDLKTLKSSHLRQMLETTRNDWRINNHNGHYIYPTGPFTGEMVVDLGSSVFFDDEVVLNVKDDVIVSVHRRLIPLPD